MKVSLRDKVDIYENFLKSIAAIDVEKEKAEALANANDPEFKYCFAFGWIGAKLNSVVRDTQYALNQGAKKSVYNHGLVGYNSLIKSGGSTK